MKTLLMCIALALTTTAHATNAATTDIKKQISVGSGFSWGAVAIPDAIIVLTQQAIASCPSGFEKLREYTAPEGGNWYLHFVVRCITPATPAPTAQPE